MGLHLCISAQETLNCITKKIIINQQFWFFFTYFYCLKNKDIMFIENAFAKNNFFWKYLVGSLIVIMATFAGQLPLAFAIGIKAIQDKKDFKSFTQQQMMTYLDKNLNLFLMLFSFLVGLFALFFVIKKLHIESNAESFWQHTFVSCLLQDQ